MDQMVLEASAMTPRQWWKLYYRQLRIIRREHMKQMLDIINFGTGFVEIGEDVPDYIRHVPLSEIFDETSPS
jgi:hypothetical protein